MAEQSKKSLAAIVSDIAGGYVSINPLFLKTFSEDSLRALYGQIKRSQTEIRTEPFPYHEVELIRTRSLKLQRLYAALGIIRNFAKEKKYRF